MPSAIEDVGRDRDHLDVGAGLGRAQHLEVDLVELALAALLRPLVAEHRAGGEELQRQLLRQLAVGDEGAADAGRVLRPQGERFAAAILKVYISFETTSVVSPMPRANSSVNSKIGVAISR